MGNGVQYLEIYTMWKLSVDLAVVIIQALIPDLLKFYYTDSICAIVFLFCVWEWS